MKEKVTVIIPNYNGKHFMEACLSSLEKQTYHAYKILVVDNASSDGSIEFMQKNYPDIELIALDQNYGFSKAVNVGILHSTTPYVLLLNNDTTVDPHFLEEMVAAIRTSPRNFSVSSKMIQMYHPDLIDSAGDFYTILGWGFGRGKDHSVQKYNTPDETFTACAGAAIYRRKVFDKIGLFDENHFAYLEDIDVGYRAKIYGYRNIYCPTAKVYHVGSGTSGSKYNSFKVRLAARNNLYLNYKNMPLLQLAVNSLPIALGMAVKYGFFKKLGFGADYLDGVKEGLATLKNCRRVPYRREHLKNYLQIEGELIWGTLLYVWEFGKRRLRKAASSEKNS